MTTQRRRSRAQSQRETAERAGDTARGKRVLLVGASGVIGGALADELKRRGYWVRGMTRTPASVTADVDEVYVGDLLDPKTFPNALRQVDVVISSAGAPPRFLGMREGRYSFRAIDDQGNRALLNAAQEAKVRRFAYVSPFGGRYVGMNEYIRAHESFATALKTSRMDYLVVRATPVFPAFDPLLRSARKGRARVIGDGSAQVNPVHPVDLAGAFIDTLEAGDEREVDIGGPEVLTRREIAELALEAWEREPKVRSLPVPFAMVWARLSQLRGGHNKMVSAALTAFAVTDLVAPEHGTRLLADYFAERVAELRADA